MRKPAERLKADLRDRLLAEQLLRSGGTPQKMASRVRAGAGMREGWANYDVARAVETARMTVLKLRDRYWRGGLEAILGYPG